MRVRTRRFEKLRSGESRDPQAVEVPDGQHPVQAHAAVAPPASCIAGNARSQIHAGPQRPQFAEHRRPALPLLELHGAQFGDYPSRSALRQGVRPRRPARGYYGLCRLLAPAHHRRPFRQEARSPQVRTRSFTAQPPYLRRLALGHESFAVLCLLALAGATSDAVRVPRLAVYAPRFLPTLGRPHAVALRLPRCGPLGRGLAPRGSRPSWAHKDKARRSGLCWRWRRGPESNRPTRICNPVHNRFATAPSFKRFARRAVSTKPTR
jgi:hypothetical protein